MPLWANSVCGLGTRHRNRCRKVCAENVQRHCATSTNRTCENCCIRLLRCDCKAKRRSLKCERDMPAGSKRSGKDYLELWAISIISGRCSDWENCVSGGCHRMEIPWAFRRDCL